jgi:hypothetical protein
MSALLAGIGPAFAQTATTTSLAVSSGAVASGTAVTLTATVKAGAISVTPGQVAFCDATAAYCTDVHRLGVAQLVAGTATLKFIPAPGSHSYKAVFIGTNTYAASNSSIVNLTVTGTAATTTSIVSGGSPGNYSETSYVVGKGETTPTGTLSFRDTSNGNYVIGTAALASGATSLEFAASTSCTTGNGPSSVVTGDFNGDGIPDVVTANATDNTLTVCLSSLNGSFTTITQSLPSSASDPTSLLAGDFDNDGKLDLIVGQGVDAIPGSAYMTLMRGNGDGTFTEKTTLQGAYTVSFPVAGDFNGDGNLDVAFIGGYHFSNSIFIFQGNGAGAFTAEPTISQTTIFATGLFAADLNNDGRTDLVFYDPPRLTVEMGNSDGSFSQTSQTLATAPGASLAGADFNKDGKIDLALIEGSSIVLLNGNGDGTFTTGSSIAATATPSFLAVDDFNGDGNADLAAILSSSSANIAVYPGNGNGTFSATATTANSPSATGLASADLNGDGFADLAVLPSTGTSVTILQGDPQSYSTATATGLSPVGSGTHQIVASYPGDANFSASVSGSSGLTAEKVTTTLSLSAAPATSTYGQQVVLTATLNPYAAQGHVTDGQGVVFTMQGRMTPLGAATLANGVATLNLTNLPVGVDALAANYAADTNFSASISNTLPYTVTAPTAATPAFSPPPGTYTSAQTVSLSTSTAGATIFYTTDGSTPTTSSAVYSAPISVAASETIQAIASAPNYLTSAVASGAYTINYPTAITTQPASQTINSGNSATLSVAATGTAPLNYQWYQVSGTSSTAIPGAISATYTTPSLTASTGFYVVVNNAANFPQTSQTAVITVIVPPTIVSQSANPAIASGQTATLSVTASGTSPAYQWYTLTGGNLTPITGALSSSYTTPALTAPASFQVTVSNSAGHSSATFQVSIDPLCTLNVQPSSTALQVLATAQCTDPQGQPLTLKLAWGDSSTPLSNTANSPATLTGSHTYAAAGTYTVTLTASDSAGLAATPLTAQVSPNNSPVCSLGSVQSTAPTIVNGTLMYPVSVVAACTDPQGQALSASINWGDGTVAAAGANGSDTHNYIYPNPANATGIYNVVLTATDTSGLSGASAPQSFQVVPATTTVAAGASSSIPSSTATTPQPSTIATTTQVTFLCTSVSAVFNGKVVTSLPSSYGISCSSPTVSIGATATPVNVIITTTGSTNASLRRGGSSPSIVVCGLALPFFGLFVLVPLTPGKRRRLAALSLVLVLCVSISGCGGSFQAPPNAPTPSALYYITVVETVVNPPAPTGFIQTSLIVPFQVKP